jgi:adenine-specific DNA-methyltransferase
MDTSPSAVESDRLFLQNSLDAGKSQAGRNRLGQFATPPALARDVIDYALRQLNGGGSALQQLTADAPRVASDTATTTPIRFLDPAVGTGSFYEALRAASTTRRVERAVGLEIDPHYGLPSAQLWKNTTLDYRLEDFTHADPEPRFNLLICNPPYVRHHHLTTEDKSRLIARTHAASGMKLSGLAGLYCHFIGLAHQWMEEGGLAGWLIPSEFMNVNYGAAVKQYLLERVTLLHIHRFDPNDVQFADALVSSAVVWFRNTPPPKNHSVRFTLGGTLERPDTERNIPASALAHEKKWLRFPEATVRSPADIDGGANIRGAVKDPVIGDFFRIRRGLATGDNRFFMLTREEIRRRKLPIEVFRPILPSPRYLLTDEIATNPDGNPIVDRQLFLLDTALDEREIQTRYPSLHAYFAEGKQRALHERYLCKHRARWYAQENRPAAPILCTYLGRQDNARDRPFRFILNRSKATAANVYLMMYPTGALARAVDNNPQLIEQVWAALNTITPEQLLGEGRVYGGGLHKLEPRELASVPAPALVSLLQG